MVFVVMAALAIFASAAKEIDAAKEEVMGGIQTHCGEQHECEPSTSRYLMSLLKD